MDTGGLGLAQGDMEPELGVSERGVEQGPSASLGVDGGIEGKMVGDCGVGV